MIDPPFVDVRAVSRFALRGCLLLALASALSGCAFSPPRAPAASAAPPPRAIPPAAAVSPGAPAGPALVAPAPPSSAAVTAPAAPPPIIVPVEPAAPVAPPSPAPAAPTFSPPAPPAVSPPAPAASNSAPEARQDAVDAARQPQDESSPAGGAKIVLVLPLQSAAFGRAAEAVEEGFKAAAQLASTPVFVVPHGDNEVLAAIDKAKSMGAAVVVGPLLRDDVKQVASAGVALPWTIALNQLDESTALPDHLYTLALSVEGEARQIARTMHDEGARDVAIVLGDSPLQRRFAASFTGEWIMQGGAAPAVYTFQRSPGELAHLRRELARMPADAILLATDAADAAIVKPYLGQATVYASSQVNDRQPPETAQDLDAIRFVEVPWLADPGADAFAAVPRREWPNAALDRLYALGFDAFQVALAFDHGPPQRLEIDGATGHLTLEPNHQIAREGKLMRFDAGHVVAADGP